MSSSVRDHDCFTVLRNRAPTSGNRLEYGMPFLLVFLIVTD